MRRTPARPPAPAPPELGGWLPPVDGARLPEDLDVLGARLEAAAGRRPARRRAVRRNGMCPIFVGVPVALATATGPVCLEDPDCRAPESPALVPVEIGTIH